MSENRQLIESFYQAFQKRDYRAMGECYHHNVVFNDPVFANLVGWQARAMWRMLCERGKDLELTYSDVESTGSTGSARWEARYTFSATGRPVHNRVSAHFEFADGKIKRHTDSFDLRAWMGMAMGAKGKLLGWLPPVQNAVKSKAMAGLAAYIAKHNLSAADFP